MNEHHTGKDVLPQKSSHTKTVGFIILAIIALVLIIVFATGNKGTEEIVEDTTSEMNEGVLTQRMRSFTEGEFTYTFRDIEWVMESEDEAGVGVPLTRLGWTLEEFSRRSSGTLVTLFNPFDLGLVRGICEEVPTLDFDYSEDMGRPLSYLACFVPGEDARIEYAAFQRNNVDIVIMRREYNDERDAGAFTEITSKNLTEIVQ